MGFPNFILLILLILGAAVGWLFLILFATAKIIKQATKKKRSEQDAESQQKEDFFGERLSKNFVYESNEERSELLEKTKELSSKVEEVAEENALIIKEFKVFQDSVYNAVKNLVLALAISKKVRKFKIIKILANFTIGDFSAVGEGYNLKDLPKEKEQEVKNLLEKFISNVAAVSGTSDSALPSEKDSSAAPAKEATAEIAEGGIPPSPSPEEKTLPPDISTEKTEGKVYTFSRVSSS